MIPETDLDRLRVEYADRDQRLKGSDLYSLFNLSYLFAIQQRQRVLVKALDHAGFKSLHGCMILEVGCGNGGVLSEFDYLGADPTHLSGIDLLHHRLIDAHKRLPVSSIAEADGQRLPYMTGFFDIVAQYTVFSSILDNRIKQGVAHDMLRVLKPGGVILWYDFWLNPTNRQTKGIKPEEIRALFPGCQFEFHKITLAPPIARKLVPVSWGMTFLLEKFKFLNTHYLAIIHPAG